MKIVVMGVAGSGKTTVGVALANRLDISFLDADDFHTPENVAKMSAGIPLDDADREPWLRALNNELRARTGVVVACSALKNRYRETLAAGVDAKFVWLKVDEETIRNRFAERSGHFMSAALIESQFASLQAPSKALIIDGTLSVQDIVEKVAIALHKGEPPA